MRLILSLSVLICCLSVGMRPIGQPLVFSPAYQESDANIRFSWAFGVLANGKTSVVLPITRDTVLKSGDELKMLVNLTKECFVYVIYYGSKGEINLLFPYEMRQFQTDYATEKNYYIPKGRKWLSLDKNTGKEIVFLLASNAHLLDLEVALGNYFSADPANRQPLAQAVVTEIRSIRKHFSTFATIAEKPLTIGGNIRGDSVKAVRRPDVADIATQIEAKNFYSKTFTIDHQ